MADVELVAESRTVTGKKVKQLRREGLVPAVLYGVGDPKHVQLNDRILARVLRKAGSNDLIDLDVAGDHHTVLVRDVQRHVTRGDLLHVDFYEVDLTQTLQAEADLIMVGHAPWNDTGLGGVNQLKFTVQIECLPNALISEIEVDVSSIVDVTSTITIGDLIVPKGVELLDDPAETIINAILFRLEEEEDELDESVADDAGDVEVIGQEEEDEE
jgi:large subunit ribosomal protein L25